MSNVLIFLLPPPPQSPLLFKPYFTEPPAHRLYTMCASNATHFTRTQYYWGDLLSVRELVLQEQPVCSFVLRG